MKNTNTSSIISTTEMSLFCLPNGKPRLFTYTTVTVNGIIIAATQDDEYDAYSVDKKWREFTEDTPAQKVEQGELKGMGRYITYRLTVGE